MSKQTKVKEFKVEKTESGQTILVTVFAEAPRKTKTKVKCRGKQTSDFALIGQWQRQPYKGPSC